MKLSNSINDNMSPSQIYAEINRRQITAMMLHKELSVMFSFLGLQGFKRWQEYRYKKESDENIKMHFHFIDYDNHLIPDMNVEAIHIIPNDWYNAENLNVSANTKKSYVNRAMLEWQEWEEETKEVLEHYYMILLKQDRVCDAEYIMCMLKDTSKELKKLERCMNKLKLVDFDTVYIAEIQEELHDKYKKKMGE